MGLASSLSTALTGLSSAETQIDVIGNNLANSQTVGFKESRIVNATQFLQTLSLGAAPSANNGGTNPRQIGLGVQVAEITPNFGQGTIEISSSPSDLAIQGQGFFMVEGGSGERLYTRNGIFKLNSNAELVNATGQRLLGYGVDDLFRIQQTSLVSLTIPLGTESVAKATENVVLEGTLTPEGSVSTISEVIQSQALGDAQVPRPDVSGVTLSSGPIADVTGTTVTTSATGTLLAGTYNYRVALVDGNGNESVISNALTATVGATGQVDLTGLPVDPLARDYPTVNVYRTDPGGTDLFFLGSAPSGGAFVDDGSVALDLLQPVDADNLTGNYTYMLTFHKAGEQESRPSVFLGPRNVVDGRVTFTDFPTPPVPPATGGFPAYDEIRIYRNLAGDQNNFYLVDTVAPGDIYTDGKTDAEIADLNLAGNKLVDLNGPTIDSNTLLTNVLRRDGNTYEQTFVPGTLSYTGRKGGRTLGTKEFQVTTTSTVQDLIDFVEESSGIVASEVSSTTPIPVSENNIIGETGNLFPGGVIQNGALRFVSNTGELNALEIDLTSFRLVDTLGNVTVPNLAFGSLQTGLGTSAATDFLAYDTLGVPLNVRITTTLERRTDEETVYRWYADSTDNQPLSGTEIGVGTGLVTFDGNGNFVATTNNRVNINRNGIPSVSPLQFELDFSAVSGLATQEASLAATRQDGSEPGVLNSFVIGDDGGIRGVFSNGITRDLGQIRLARFANPVGLEERGQNLFAQGINTGLPVEGSPGENGIGTVIGGALELSNTDIGKDLINLVLASTQYRGNSRVITASQELLDELLNLSR